MIRANRRILTALLALTLALAAGWAYRAGNGNYGVHGYLNVPYYPASHGCIRVHVWDADYLHERFYIGMPVHVWDR